MQLGRHPTLAHRKLGPPSEWNTWVQDVRAHHGETDNDIEYVGVAYIKTSGANAHRSISRSRVHLAHKVRVPREEVCCGTPRSARVRRRRNEFGVRLYRI